MTLIDLQQDVIKGGWQMVDGSLVGDGIAGAARVRIPVEPPEEYDFRIEFTRLRNSPHGDVNQLLYASGRSFTWLMGGWGNKRCGFQTITGPPPVGGKADRNSTSTTYPSVFEDGKRYTSVVRVRKGLVSAELNGKPLAQFKTDFSNLRVDDHWYVGNRLLGLGTENKTAFHKIELVQVTGRGRVAARNQVEGLPDLGRPPPADKPVRTVNLLPLIDPAGPRGRVLPNVADGAISSPEEGPGVLLKPKGRARVRIGYEPPREYDFRIEFTRTDGEGGIVQCLWRPGDLPAQPGREFNWLLGGWQNTASGLEMVHRRMALDDDKTCVRTPIAVRTGTRHTSVVHVRDGRVAVSLDGKLVFDYRTDYSDLTRNGAWAIGPRALGVGAEAPTLFHAIEVAEIGGQGKAIAPGVDLAVVPPGLGAGGGKPPGAGRLFPADEAKKIVFVCDASGSMLPRRAALMRELKGTVAGLNAAQSFNVLFFSAGRSPVQPLNRVRLPATPENVRRLTQFLDGTVELRGSNPNPLPALEQAFRLDPEVIYLLSDGSFPNNDAVLTRVREWNRGAKAKVHTIAFGPDAAGDAPLITLLETIARETGGMCRRVSEDQLE